MSEITYSFIRDYLQAISKEDPDMIYKIRREALKNGVPIIKNEVKQLLEVMLSIIKPETILEIGTAVGYSSILMSGYLKPGGHITTIERWDEMADAARENIEAAGRQETITMLSGDAMEILPTLTGTYDIIFMDAAKAQYIHFFPHCMRLLKSGGVLISDNVLQEGYIAKNRWSIPRRQRTIHARMREYLWEINHHPDLTTVILPAADGVTISYKK